MAKMALPRDGAGRMSFSLVVSLNMSHNPICDSGLEHIGRHLEIHVCYMYHHVEYLKLML